MKNKLNALMVLMTCLLLLMSMIVLCPSMTAGEGDDSDGSGGDDDDDSGDDGGDDSKDDVKSYGWYCFTAEMFAQGFLPSFNIITSINLTVWQRSISNDTAQLHISLYHSLEREAIASAVIASTDLPENRKATQVIIDFPDTVVNPSDMYYIVWNPEPDEFSELFVWKAVDNNPYPEGNAFYYNTTELCWISLQNYSTKHPDPDFVFTILGFHDDAPLIPIIQGPVDGDANKEYTYTMMTTDQNSDMVSYFIDWGDGTNSGWFGPYESGAIREVTHIWNAKGNYIVKVKAKDIYGLESDWATLTVTMPCSYDRPIPQFLELLFQRFPHAFPLLRQLMGY